MAKKYSTEHFIKERVAVEDSGRAMTFTKGSSRRGGPFDREVENLYFLGLEGSGRRTVAKAVAERLGLEFVDLTGEAAVPEAMDQLLADHGKAAALGRAALGHGPMQEALAKSRAYFLLADMPLLVERLGRDMQLRERLLADMAELEPAAMALARHTLRASKDLGDLLDDVDMTLAMPL